MRQLTDLEAMDVAVLTRELLQGLEPRLRGKGLQVVDDMLDAGTVCGNRFLMTQTLHNLLDNAIDFSPKGGRLVLSLKPDAGWVTWSVVDQGPGVPDYALGRIFERFYSLPRGDTQDRSSGLGLCLVQEVSALHGGVVTVENVYAAKPAPAKDPAAVTGCRAGLRLPSSHADR